MREPLLGVALAFSLAACSVDIADGRFSCFGDSECPNDFVCRCGSLDGTPACPFGCPASWPCEAGHIP